MFGAATDAVTALRVVVMAGFFAAITADLSGSLGQLSELVDAFFTYVSSDEDLADRYDLVNEL